MTHPNQPPAPERRWDDYRFNGYRTTLEQHRDMWKPVLELAQQQLNELGAGQAAGHIDAMDAALRLLDVWVLAIQEDEGADK